MGTNFYALADATCDNPEHTERLHIGKSSGGWKFGFHAIPERGLTSWAAWADFLAERIIVNEYGEEMTLFEFTPTVEDRWVPPNLDGLRCRVGLHGDDRDFHDDEGYDFYVGEFS